MASKINSRLKSDKARSGKPYDRPKQSLLRKVATAVMDIITPSWFQNVPSWRKPSEEETVPTTETVESEVQDEVPETVSEVTVQRPSKRPRCAPDDLEAIDVTAPRTGIFSSPSVVNNSVMERVENNNNEVIPSCQLEKKTPQLMVNGDDHSENSEGTASTSGCSSFSSHVDKPDHPFSSIKLSQTALDTIQKELKAKGFQRFKKEAAVSTENSFSSACDRSANQNDFSLWSRDSHLSMRITQKPQSAFQSSRPSFSLASFGGPPLASSTLSSKEKVSSPFYEGKTTYGGASAYRRAQLSSLPYQSQRSLRSKITVKPSHSTDDFECMSSAAKRILHSLEKMSTPLTDAKKIPNVRKSPADVSASFTPASQRFNSYLSSRRSSPYTKGPPISDVTSSSRLSLLKNFPKMSKNSKMEIPVHKHSSVSLDTTTQSSVPDTEANKGAGGGGKIRTRLHQQLHQSSKTSDVHEMPEELHLPDVRLPITDLPTISFGAKDKPEATCEEDRRSVTPQEPLFFTFASPIDHSPPPILLQSHQSFMDPSYAFSSPFNGTDSATTPKPAKTSVEKEETENRSEKKEESQLHKGSVNDFLKTLRDSSKKSDRKSSVREDRNCSNTYKADKELLEPVDLGSTGFGDKFKPAIGSWECTSCLVRNNHDSNKCVACEASKPGSVDKLQSQNSSSGSTFKPLPGTSECPSCLDRNKDDFKTCASCETMKTGSSVAAAVTTTASATAAPVEKEASKSTTVGFGDKFKPSSGSWECQSCLVRNEASAGRCIACETENPNVSKHKVAELSAVPLEKTENSKNKTFKGVSADGSWACDACMEQNPVGQLKCVACETPKVSTETAGSKSSGFKFGFTAPANSTAFRFGSLVASPVSTSSSTFKFGDISEAPKQQGTVKFGSSTLPATGSVIPTAPTEGFKFNSTPSTEPGGFKFGNFPTSDNTMKPSEALFKKETLTVKSSKDSVSDPAVTSGFTFGSLNSDQNKTSDHSKTVTVETSEVTAQKTETSTVTKPNLLSDGTAVQLPKPSPLFPSKTPVVLASTSNIPSSTTLTSSSVTSSGFVFGNTNSSQLQSSTTFQFGNKTDDIKTISSAATSAQTTTVFTSAAMSAGISSPAPFSFSSQPNKQFPLLSESTAANAATDNHQAMSQETPAEVQSSSEINSSNTLSFPPTSTPLQSTNFIFGNTNAPVATSSSALFKFSSTVTTASDTTSGTPKGSGIFTFGVPSNTEIKDSKTGFSFANSAEEKPQPQPLPQSQFSFGGFKQDGSNPISTSSLTAATSSPFRFGASSTHAPVSTGGFVFGPAKPDVSQAAKFSFGPSATTKPLSSSSFGGFSQNQAVTTTTMSNFFGIPTSSAAPVSVNFTAPISNPSNLFTFGNKPTPAVPSPVNSSGALPNPIFGGPKLGFETQFNSASAVPSFGKPPEQKPEAPSFSFGSSSSQGPVFRFGNTQDGPQEKRHAAAPQPGGFNFSLSQPNAMNNTMNFNPTTPANFNFAGGPLAGGPPIFQFNADATTSQNAGARKIRKAVRRGVRKPD